MGNSYPANIQQQTLISQHPRLNNAKVISENNHNKIQVSFKLQNNEYDQWIKTLEHGSTKIHSEFLLLPQSINFKHDQGICANTGTLNIEYPYFPCVLSELIKSRHNQHNLFKQSDLWSLLHSITTALHDIRQYSPKLGDINPSNILVNLSGDIKLVNVYSWPNEFTSYSKALDRKRFCYSILLAPEDVFLLSKGASQNQSNQLSQIFAIGATILIAAIQADFLQVYNYRAKIFNVSAFKQIRQEWAEHPQYSQIFKAIILNLTSYDQNDRLQLKQLWQWICQYRSSIESKKQFIINSMPLKIQKSLEKLRSNTY